MSLNDQNSPRSNQKDLILACVNRSSYIKDCVSAPATVDLSPRCTPHPPPSSRNEDLSRSQGCSPGGSEKGERSPRDGVSVNNNLKARLYDNARNSQVLQQARFPSNRTSTANGANYINTFKLGRRKRSSKQVKNKLLVKETKSEKSAKEDAVSNPVGKEDTSYETNSLHCEMEIECKTNADDVKEIPREDSAISIESSASSVKHPDQPVEHDSALSFTSTVETFEDILDEEANLKKEYQEKSILTIIHMLFERLGWHTDGILQGEIPVELADSVDTKKQKRIDDGEFVYTVPRSAIINDMRYNPYDLVSIKAKHARKFSVFFTVSATYISKVSKTQGTELTPTFQWMYERKLFYSIYEMKIFKEFRIWKTFLKWKNILREAKTTESRTGIDRLLFTNCKSFQGTILKIKCMCEELIHLTPSNQKFLTPLLFDVTKTYTLEEFCKKQQSQVEKVKKTLKVFRIEVLKLVHGACDFFYQANLNEIEKNIKDIEEKELVQKTGFKPKKIYKNFQLIKEKYNIVENEPADNPATILANQTTTTFKYARIIKLKAVCERIHSFVRLVDFIVQDMLRCLVLSAINILQAQVAAACALEMQPNLFLLYQWECSETPQPIGNSKVQELQEKVQCVSLFYVDLVLNSEPVELNRTEKTEYNENPIKSTRSKTCFSSLSPSKQEFERELSTIFSEYESIVSTFPSLLKDSFLKKYVVAQQVSEFQSTHVKKSEDILQLLFADDLHYQGCLSDILGNMNTGMECVISYVKQFDIFCSMIEASSLTDVKKSLRTEWTTEQFYVILGQFTEQVRDYVPQEGYNLKDIGVKIQVACMENMPTLDRKMMFHIRTDTFQSTCLPYPKRIIYAVNEHLPKIATNKNETLLRIIKRGERTLSTSVLKVEDFVEHLACLDRVSSELPKLDNEFKIITQLFKIAFQYEAQFTDEERAQYKTLAPSFQKLKSLVMYCEAKKDENILRFSRSLDSIVDNLTKQLHQVSILIRNPTLLEEDVGSMNAVETIKFLTDDLDGLSKNAKNFASYESTFQNALSLKRRRKRGLIGEDAVSTMTTEQQSSKVSFLQEEIAEVERDLMLRKLLWESIEEWESVHVKWRKSPFQTFDVATLMKEMSRFVQTVLLLEKGLPVNPILPDLKKKIMMFKHGMPVISSLRNPALKQRHWDEINEVTDTPIRDDKCFLLGNLIDLDIFKHKDRISEISTQASNEATLEQMLNKVKEFWKNCDFELLAHGTRDVAIITKVDDILTSLDDSLVTLSNIRGSRYCLPLQAEINDWDRKLNLFLRTFEEWIIVQRNWLYLETVFSAADIQRQLPYESKLFQLVDKSWRDIMRRAIDRPNALAASTSAGLLDVLQACNSNLEKIHRSLEDYLETKRLVFSRFYFLSNDELLDILANSKKVTAVQPYLSKCFGNCNKLDFDLKQRPPVPVCAMISMEKEKLELPKAHAKVNL